MSERDENCRRRSGFCFFSVIQFSIFNDAVEYAFSLWNKLNYSFNKLFLENFKETPQAGDSLVNSV